MISDWNASHIHLRVNLQSIWPHPVTMRLARLSSSRKFVWRHMGWMNSEVQRRSIKRINAISFFFVRSEYFGCENISFQNSNKRGNWMVFGITSIILICKFILVCFDFQLGSHLRRWGLPVEQKTFNDINSIKRRVRMPFTHFSQSSNHWATIIFDTMRCCQYK